MLTLAESIICARCGRHGRIHAVGELYLSELPLVIAASPSHGCSMAQFLGMQRTSPKTSPDISWTHMAQNPLLSHHQPSFCWGAKDEASPHGRALVSGRSPAEEEGPPVGSTL